MPVTEYEIVVGFNLFMAVKKKLLETENHFNVSGKALDDNKLFIGDC